MTIGPWVIPLVARITIAASSMSATICMIHVGVDPVAAVVVCLPVGYLLLPAWKPMAARILSRDSGRHRTPIRIEPPTP